VGGVDLVGDAAESTVAKRLRKLNWNARWQPIRG
jgi:hypothetical protein